MQLRKRRSSFTGTAVDHWGAAFPVPVGQPLGSVSRTGDQTGLAPCHRIARREVSLLLISPLAPTYILSRIDNHAYEPQ